jgi:hypothetical protein
MRSGWALLIFVAMAIVAGCGGHSGTPGPLPSPYTSPFTSPPTSPPSQAPFAPQNYIKHVVFIIQENRSFDNLFYGYPGANTATSGLRRARVRRCNCSSVPLDACYDVDHDEIDFLTEYNGGAMNGFDQILSAGCTPPTDAAYAYVPAAESAPYFALAKQFVLADNNFASQIDASWTAHQFLIAAQSDLTVDAPDHLPWGCDSPADTTVPTLNSDRTQGPGISPCLNYTTFGDELDAKRRELALLCAGDRQQFGRHLERIRRDQSHSLWFGLGKQRHLAAQPGLDRHGRRQSRGHDLDRSRLR